MLEELKHRVCAANLAMLAGGLVFRAWGTVSGVDRGAGLMVITPVGGAHEGLKCEHLARLASLTIEIEPYPKSLSPKMLEMHYLRGQASGSDNQPK